MTEDKRKQKITRFKQFLTMDPQNAALKLDLAELLIDSKLLNQAQKQLDELAEIALDLDQSISLGGLYLQCERMDKAKLIFDHLYQQHPQNDIVAFSLVVALFQLDEFEQAKAVFESSGLNKSLEPGAMKFYARIRHACGEVSEAIKTLKQVIEHDDDDAEAHGFLALCYFDINELELAAKHCRLALEIDSEQHEAMLISSYLALAYQDIDLAIPQTIKLIKRDKKNGRAWMNLATAYMLNGEFVKALDAASTACKLMPKFIGIWHLRGWIELLSDQLNAAKASFETGYRLDRSFGESHGNLAVIFAILKDKEKTEYHISRANRLAPNNIAGHFAEVLLLNHTDPEAAAIKYKIIEENLPFDNRKQFEVLVEKFMKRVAQ
ncbi:MAG: tetratricopeptide repeat protein [Francisellaceae bacterium]